MPEQLSFAQSRIDWSAREGAVLSPCGTYRYLLWRAWAVGVRFVFVMLNPSVATAEKDDLTLLQCVEIAKHNGAAGLWIVNLYGFRSSNPNRLCNVADPFGPDNEKYLLDYVRKGHKVICAWGNQGDYGLAGTSAATIEKLRRVRQDLYVLGITAQGQPIHPMARGKHRIKPTTPLILWEP